MSTPHLEIRNPADRTVVGTVPDSAADNVTSAVAELRAQQPGWEALGPQGRARWLARLRDWILDHEAEIADVVRAETGKPQAEARIEGPLLCDHINYWSSHVEKFLAEEHPRSHTPLTAVKRLVQIYRPYQVVGVVSPWNFPLLLPGVDAVPALLAGAAVAIKPSELTPLSVTLLERAWSEIGAPPVLRVLTGGAPTGEAVVDTVDYVQFTGSTKTGRRIARACAERLIPYSLELGGKDPAIVLADADLDRAVNGVLYGGLMNSGQVCISIERVYVEAPVYEDFVARLGARIATLRQAQDDGSCIADIGAMTAAAQVQIVDAHVRDAVEKGATVLAGGASTGGGAFFEPTLLVDVDHSMACMRDESFGPTIPVMKVADVDEAIQLANDSRYGLSATVWTGDVARGEKIARRLEVGAVNVNDAFTNMFCIPLSQAGWKESGVGSRSGGANGIRKYCRPQVITKPRWPTMKSELLWYPYHRARMDILGRLVRLLVARDPLRALGIRPPWGRPRSS